MKRKEFERCTPESVGIPSGAILRFLDRLEYGGFTEMHGLMIMRHDKVCAEGWWAPYAPGLHHALHSLSKTWTATAIGLAEYEGLLKVTDRVCDLLPEYMPDPLPERVARITVRDVLTMASGSETEKADYAADWIRDFFARPFEHEPGTFWRYNSHGTAILSAITEKVTGMSMIDWLDERLFRVIGVDKANVMCYRGEDGTCLGGHGMFTTTEDNLRLMRLYLHGGVWEGTRLLSEAFVRDATSPMMDNAPAHAHTPWICDNRCGYGYQIWMCRPEGSYRADGAYGQFTVVVPSLDLIVSINEAAYIGQHMSHNELEQLVGQIPQGPDHPLHGPQCTLNALFELLTPAIDPDVHKLPESPEATILRERMRRLAIPCPKAIPPYRSSGDLDLTLIPDGQGISFRMLHGMDKHNKQSPGAERIRLHTENGVLTVDFTEDGVARCILADMRGGRLTGKLIYTDHGEIVSDIASAAWWNGDRLELSVLWYETENHNRYTFAFEPSRVLIHKWTEAALPDPLAERDAIYQYGGQ
ncbi:MAG: serine hydrolase [Clostridia bacterium]|nr:serine hydrolase [Clostridia bacterium]